MKNLLYHFILLFAFTSLVTSDCASSISQIPLFIQVKETEADITLFNITYDPLDIWEFTSTKVNSIKLNGNKPKVVNMFFNLTSDPDAGYLSLHVENPLDLEQLFILIQYKVNSFTLSFTCGRITKPKEVDVIILAVDESTPRFINYPFELKLDENTAVGTSVFDVSSHIKDDEIRPNRRPIYYIELYTTNQDVSGFDYFTIPLSATGIVQVKQVIDFDDRIKRGLPTYFMLNLTVWRTEKLKSWTTLNVSIQDVDDQNPAFNGFVPPTNAQYSLNTGPGYRGALTTTPRPIIANDPDTAINNSIIYSLERVPYIYHTSFAINPNTGEIRQIADVLSTGVLQLKATENSVQRRSTDATILVTLGNDTTVPPPQPKTAKKESNSLLLAIIILAVVALLIIIIIIVVFVIYHKKTIKAVSPKDDGTDEGSGEIAHSLNWQETSGSKSELLANEMLNPAYMATLQGRGNTLPPLTRDSATETGKKRSRRRNKNKEPEIFDGTREYEGKLDLQFFEDANTKAKIKQSTRSKDSKTDPKYWITIPNDDD